MRNATNQMNTETKLQKIVVAPIASSEAITIQRAFEAAASRSLDKESLAVMKELLAMDAERKFTTAFVKLRSKLPVITAKTIIPNRGKYEKFEDLMTVLQPLLDKHGFCVSFSQSQDAGRVTAECELMHVAGHRSVKSFTVRTGGKSDSETQADCKATTTAKRGALTLTFNITIRQDCLTSDEDITIEGDPNDKVTQAQAEELEHRAKMLNSDIPALLKYAKVSKFSDIPARLYAELDRLLARKEKQGR
jgi:hypothetical protein